MVVSFFRLMMTGGPAPSWKFLACSCLLFLLNVSTVASSGSSSSHGEESTTNSSGGSGTSPLEFDQIAFEGESEEDHHHEPAHAVLFPAFAMTIGLVVFYILTRYIHTLPFTAVMFLIGTLMGIGVELRPDADDHLSVTTAMWTDIDSEVLLLVFLPGLIFKDAFGLNVHLFRVALSQCLMFAFPMVLLGTIMTASVVRYIFPYGWSWNLAMTMGSILSATDPVAVAALLEEVGAPPRLKVHIGGEALLNDGAAIVFFTIFAERYYFELGKEGLGEEVDWGRGFALFFRMALGGAAIGFAFGLGMLFMLWALDKRFSREENVVEVTATAALAYTGYYVAELVCHTSGVIATVAAGVTVKFLGRASLNDSGLLDDFWVLVEHILNTILFMLGGAVWGSVIANGEKQGDFVARDWGYLLLLYVFLLLIRGVLFLFFYPITVRIGLKTNLKETFFQVYGGLRGAVGIALAIALDHAIRINTEPDSDFREETNKAFGMVGGVAFLTLVINGTTAGPLLIKLGLADSSETRKKIVDAYTAGFKQHMIQEFVSLLSQYRFRNTNFGLVKSHVPYLADLTKAQLVDAMQTHKETTSSDEYMPPHVQGVIPYLADDEEDYPTKGGGMTASKSTENLLSKLTAEVQKAERAKRAQNRAKRRRRKSNIHHLMSGEPMSTQEMRMLFISLLKAMYEKQIDHGELVDRELMAVALQQSLEFAEDNVANGGMLNDWDYVCMMDRPASGLINQGKHNPFLMKLVRCLMGKHSVGDLKYTIKRLKMERAMNFMAAHKDAQHFVAREFADAESELSEAARIVINESEEQWKKAEAVLHTYNRADVEDVISHKFCTILLNSGQHYVSKLVRKGLLKDDEAEHWVKEIEGHLHHVLECTAEAHPGEMSIERVDDDCSAAMFKDTVKRESPVTHSLTADEDGMEISAQEVQEAFKDLDYED